MGLDVRIALLSNIILEPYFLPQLKRLFGGIVSVASVPLGEYREAAYRDCLAGADVIVVWPNLEEMAPDFFYDAGWQKSKSITAFCKAVYDYLQDISIGKILWLSFEDYSRSLPVAIGHGYDGLADRLNIALLDFLDRQVSFIDMKCLIARAGLLNAYSHKGKRRWNAPYTEQLLEIVAEEIWKQYAIERGATKKCLVLDCDNVLWGGILIEDGLEKLRLGDVGPGRVYQEFQRFVLSLHRRGVILAVCSRNNLHDVLTVFREHSGMILKEGHIACFQVNWEDKPGNIRKVAGRLGIGFDSMVFVDDSPAEIEAVRATLPDVEAILFRKDMAYDSFSCFHLKANAAPLETERRNETYRTDQCREELQAGCADYEDYIRALEVRVDIHEAESAEYGRIAELTQRTNRCTNGKRYTAAELKRRLASGKVRLYSVHVSDRFSDLGLVGAMEVEGRTLTLFSLSCRALGRGVERIMLEMVSKWHDIKEADFQSTGKNGEMEKSLAFHGKECPDNR